MNDIYVPRMKPRAHQDKARQLTRGKRLFAYLCEMGTGKTKMVLDEWGERVLAGTVHDLLVIAPAGSYRNWDLDKGIEAPSELRKHFDPDLFRATRSAAWVSGAGKVAREHLKRFLDSPSRPGTPSYTAKSPYGRPRVFIVNIEALSGTEEAIKACTAFLSAPGRKAMIVVDESTAIKNDRALRTRTVIKLKDMGDLRRIMTGLISPRSPLDLFSQFEFLDWRILGHESIYTFKRRYCVLEQMQIYAGLDKKGKPKYRKFDQIVGYRNLPELQEKIAPYSYRVLKSECLDLPPKIYLRREVQLTDVQKRLYNDLVLFSTAELKAAVHITTTMVITKILRLHQLVCGHTVDEEGSTHDVESNRIKALLETLEEHQGKAIIWINYRHEIEKVVSTLEKEYGKGCVSQFHGGNKASRGKEESEFLSNPQRRFMVATQSAGGRGNTWVVANLVVYFSNSYDLELRMQSEDRSHRDGLTHSVTYVDLVAPRTIDEKIQKALRKKLDMATLISGEGYREWII
jgi:hypothetical protein